MSFKEYRLGEIYTISSGLSKSSSDFGFGYPFLTFKDVFYNFFVPDKLESLANTTDKERINCSIKRGDVFLTRTSETLNELGMSAVALEDYPNATFNGFTKRLRIKVDNLVLPEYAGFYFRSQMFRDQVNSMSTMTTRASLNNSMIEKLTINLPDIGEQLRIARALLSINNKIEVNNKIGKTLETIAQLVFEKWFIDFEFPNEGGEPYKSSGGVFVESELGRIPEGWSIITIDDICGKVGSGGTPSRKKSEYYGGNILWLKTKELDDKYIFNSEEKLTQIGLEQSSAKLYPANTVVMAMYGATVGKLGITSKEMSFNQAMCGMVVNEDKQCYEYLYLWLVKKRNDIISLATGSAQQNLNVGLIKSYSIIMPEHRLIGEFKKIIRPIFQRLENAQKENELLIDIRDTLLPKLISGQIRIPLEPEADVS